MAENLVYDIRPARAPILRGQVLRLVVRLLEKPWIAAILGPMLTRDLGVRELRAREFEAAPAFLPLHPQPDQSPGTATALEDVPPASHGPGFRFRTIRDFERVYRSGIVTPEMVADRVLTAMAASENAARPLRAFIASNREDVLSQARDSAWRYRQGRPRGPLDGVPIAIKDEIDMRPYPTTAGTRFLGSTPATQDATVVARLRAAGALLIGKTNMHEIGILPNGLNPHFGPVRNPYDLEHDSGGSSSGSAAAVAAGLCPAAVGADGGGSIRIPAAYCGLAGLKPTYGRVSESGAVPLCPSVAHLGPIAAGAEDAALVYAVIAGADAADPHTQHQPAVRIAQYEGGLEGVRIGVYRDWFSDAASDIVTACESMLGHFVGLGAEIVDVTIPDLRLTAVAHGLTIHAEMAANMDRYDAFKRQFGWTTRLMLANIRALRSSDYVQAQRMRAVAIRNFQSALAQCDVIATPTVPMTAPPVTNYGAKGSEANVVQTIEALRFVNPANMTGLPAITVPAGYGAGGLPVGLQLIARAWDEASLFRLAYAAEGGVERRKPGVYFDLLPEIDEIE